MLSIIIVNYNTADLALDCLRSLSDQVRALPGARVFLVDNASPDNSAAKISTALDTESLHDFVTFIPLSINAGYAAGNNAGIRAALAPPDNAAPAVRPALQTSGALTTRINNDPALPDYILLLNPDTLVRPGALDILIDFMQSHRDAGIAGSRLENPDASPQPSAFRFHSIAGEFEQGIHLGLVSRLFKMRVVAPPPPIDTATTDWVAGAAMIIRRAVIDDIGLLDEAYFLYFEEVDFCLRAARCNWKCYYVPTARVVHLVGQASGVTSADRRQRPLPRYWFDSRYRYFRVNYGLFTTIAANLAFTTGHILYRLRCLLTFKKPNIRPRLLRDFLRYNFFTPPRQSTAAAQSRVHATPQPQPVPN